MKLLATAAAAAMMMLCAGAAAAQDQTPPGGAPGGPGGGGMRNSPMMAKMREACAADYTKFCPDKTGPDRRQCVMDNRDKFSDTCKSAMADMMKARVAAAPSQ